MEKQDEKTICLETVKAIDLRQRKTRYRVWMAITIIVSFGIASLFFYAQFLMIKEINSIIGYDISPKLSGLSSILILIFPFAMFILSFIVVFWVNNYLVELYFPKEVKEK